MNLMSEQDIFRKVALLMADEQMKEHLRLDTDVKVLNATVDRELLKSYKMVHMKILVSIWKKLSAQIKDIIFQDNSVEIPNFGIIISNKHKHGPVTKNVAIEDYQMRFYPFPDYHINGKFRLANFIESQMLESFLTTYEKLFEKIR